MGLDNPLHIAFLVVILLLVFGARRLPEIGRSLGSGMREFKQSITGEGNTQQPEQPQQPALGAGSQQAPVQNAPQAAPAQAAPAQAAPVAQPAAVGQPAGEQPAEQQRA
jgi:sec-independent protein translocase protein TatA